MSELQRIHISIRSPQIFWQFTWHFIHTMPQCRCCCCRGFSFLFFIFIFFVFWPTLQLETDDNKKLYYTQAHPFDLMAVECAAFNASPGMRTRSCWVGFSWVGLGWFGWVGWWRAHHGRCQVCVGNVVCASGDHASVHIFRFWGPRELLII